MKRLSAFLLVVAVLNPLCCCLAASEATAKVNPAPEHVCCPGETEKNQAPHQTPSDCPHKILSDKDAVIPPENSLQAAPFVTQIDQAFKAFSVDSLYANQSSLATRPSDTAHITPWIRTQTDCVRLL